MGYQLTTKLLANSLTGVKIAANFWTTKDAVATLLFAHATGFHKETWDPTIYYLKDSSVKCNFIAFDARNHGNSALENKSLLSDECSWRTLSEDILGLVEQLRFQRPLIGIGHSMGGCTTLLAEESRPNTFDGIVAFEPILHPTKGSTMGVELVEPTKRRRSVWENRQAVREYLNSKRFFRTWDKRVLEEYVNNGTYQNPGGKIELKCPPSQEAATFAGAPAISEYCFENLNKVKIPVSFVGGDRSATILPDNISIFAKECPQGVAHVIPGHHLIPQEQPENTARIIHEFVASLVHQESQQASQAI
ncbi:alpha/beta-hydrolase [Basidiobolus meristosporus CBS 931.73]|uniref:Alpha/beta-hydrolase n=1 Tax=Basidiobolus meristosporus CBS 931.73 TaxID=1314790 RepID=A0A1Y1Z970_9FUNG|nr:alpha/beta-hydrolase [Basidiobolus meristosporus CBS 931.73]|eukprot:ORY06726.1 alpha/beta-hydrolase [Basidiobolus meristosporus CBS 931.73]